jgi:hypothetical protein
LGTVRQEKKCEQSDVPHHLYVNFHDTFETSHPRFRGFMAFLFFRGLLPACRLCLTVRQVG